VLNQAAKEIERLREEIKQLRSGHNEDRSDGIVKAK
jgi:hypothetical protein